MRVRSLVLCMALLLGAGLGAAGCSSSAAKPAPGKVAGTPTGTVTVRSGGKVVCVITLNKNGTGTCQVTAGQPGKVTYTGTYDGGSGFDSGSASTTVTVLPAKPAGPVASSAGPAAS